MSNFSGFGSYMDSLKGILQTSMFTTPNYTDSLKTSVISKYEIDPESTLPYQLQKQTDQIIEKSNEQNKLLIEQNKQLADTCSKLGELCEAKEQEAREAREEAKKSRRYNFVMLVISIISMLVAVAAWLQPNMSNFEESLPPDAPAQSSTTLD